MQQQHPIATWNKDKDFWQTPEMDIFGHSVAYSETLPKSGMTRNGQLYELPTLAPPTTGQESSSSPNVVFSTPDTMPDAPNTGSNMKHHPAGLGNQVSMLPTPAASDYKRDDYPADRKRKSPSITTVSVHFPTPAASDSTGGGQHPSKRKGHTKQLIDTVLELNGENTPPLFEMEE